MRQKQPHYTCITNLRCKAKFRVALISCTEQSHIVAEAAKCQCATIPIFVLESHTKSVQNQGRRIGVMTKQTPHQRLDRNS